jgi:hypothetical protein
MREEVVKRLKMETQNVRSSLEKLEREFNAFEKDLAESKEIKKLARFIVSGKFSKEMKGKKNNGTSKF